LVCIDLESSHYGWGGGALAANWIAKRFMDKSQ